MPNVSEKTNKINTDMCAYNLTIVPSLGMFLEQLIFSSVREKPDLISLA